MQRRIGEKGRMEEGKQWKKTKWDGNENDGAIQRGAAIVLACFGCGQSSLAEITPVIIVLLLV